MISRGKGDVVEIFKYFSFAKNNAFQKRKKKKSSKRNVDSRI